MFLVYNYKGYFDDLFAQLNKCVKHGFLDEGSLKFERWQKQLRSSAHS